MDIFFRVRSPRIWQRDGFPDDCKITPFTGDNLQSLIGLAVKKDELVVSIHLQYKTFNLLHAETTEAGTKL